MSMRSSSRSDTYSPGRPITRWVEDKDSELRAGELQVGRDVHVGFAGKRIPRRVVVCENHRGRVAQQRRLEHLRWGDLHLGDLSHFERGACMLVPFAEPPRFGREMEQVVVGGSRNRPQAPAPGGTQGAAEKRLRTGTVAGPDVEHAEPDISPRIRRPIRPAGDAYGVAEPRFRARVLAQLSRKSHHLHGESRVTRPEAGGCLDETEPCSRGVVRVGPDGDAAAGVHQACGIGADRIGGQISQDGKGRPTAPSSGRTRRICSSRRAAASGEKRADRSSPGMSSHISMSRSAP